MSEKRSKRACDTCKHRKKRCSGGVPCDYCVKIGKPQECIYHTRLPSKTVKITEKYLQSLKTKIKDLERQLDNTGSICGADELTDSNPLVSSDEDDVAVTSEVPIDSSEALLNLGDSACAKYLLKNKQSLVRSCDLTGDITNSNFETISVDTSPNISLIEALAAEVCPSIEDAKNWISAASRIIGADYMFIEKDYETEILEPIIYHRDSNKVGFMKTATELTRFFSYLALGRLFVEHISDRSSRSKFPGLIYFESALKLQGELLKVSDRVANGSLIQSFLYVAYYALSLDKSALALILVGNAIRFMYILGYHKYATNVKENRIFWLCYVYDRLVAVRFGFPLSINELDIDVPLLPLAEDSTYLSVSLDIYHFVSQVKLARIATQILTKIYTKNSSSFIQNCNVVLKELKSWLDDLPPGLILDLTKFSTDKSRSTVNLHMNYNYLIIITTRPVLLYVFNKIITNGKDADALMPKKLLAVIQVLVESCIRAAHLQSLVLTKLYYDGNMAKASFLDCHYIFNSTIILIFAAFCQSMPYFTLSLNWDMSIMFERVEVNLSLLQKLSQYNISASNFNRQLTEIIDLLSSQKVQAKFNGFFHSTSDNHAADDEAANLRSIDLDSLGNIDLARVLDDLSDSSNSSDLVFFDNDDFMKYSNSMF